MSEGGATQVGQPRSTVLLKMPEVAEILNCSTARCYEMARTQILPVVRLGRQLRIDREKLQEWINNGGQALGGGWRRAELEESSTTRVEGD